jgi:hypothetical protein
MQKHGFDLLVGVLLTCVSVGLLTYYFWPAPADQVVMAYVYHKADLLEKPIDLSKESTERTFTVTGDVGEVVIAVKKDAIKIAESGCANHTCVKQGYISRAGQTLICVPNGIYIYLKGESYTITI